MYTYYEMRDGVTYALAYKDKTRLQRLNIMDSLMFEAVLDDMARDMNKTVEDLLKNVGGNV